MDVRFHIGDYVVVHKPEDVDEHPRWTRDMEDCDGAVANIRDIRESFGEIVVALEGRDSCSVNGWSFNVKWLSPLVTFEAADLSQFMKEEMR